MGSMASVIAQHLEKTPAFDSLAILPTQVVAVLRRMLEKDKTKRIQTPWELRLGIEILHREPVRLATCRPAGNEDRRRLLKRSN